MHDMVVPPQGDPGLVLWLFAWFRESRDSRLTSRQHQRHEGREPSQTQTTALSFASRLNISERTAYNLWGESLQNLQNLPRRVLYLMSEEKRQAG
jgi:hypothetical protein